MITGQDLQGLWDYYSPETEEKARMYSLNPLDMVKEFAEITGQKPNETLYASLVHEEYEEWKSARQHESREAELKELTDLAYVVFGYASALGWDLMESLRRVHKNNVGRCIQPDGTVKRREDGKILKNKDYPKVDLKDLV